MRFDFEQFERYHLDQFKDRTRRIVGTVHAAEKGKALASDDLTEGYLNQKTYDQTVADLDARRIKAKSEFRPILDDFNASAREFAEHQLTTDMAAMVAIAPVLELMGGNDADYMDMARKYNNYAQLRMIASAASKNGAVKFGEKLSKALDSVRSNTDEVFGGGLGTSAEKGVLGINSAWESSLDSKLGRVKRAVNEVDVVIGAAEAPKSSFEQVLYGGIEHQLYNS